MRAWDCCKTRPRRAALGCAHFRELRHSRPSLWTRDGLQVELEKLCHSCKGEGLDDASIEKILSGTRAILDRARKPLTNSAVLSDFNPLNVVVLEHGIGFSDFARMEEDGSTYMDPATFLACVEALEKYPFCNRTITTEVQENFLDATAPPQPSARSFAC